MFISLHWTLQQTNQKAVVSDHDTLLILLQQLGKVMKIHENTLGLFYSSGIEMLISLLGNTGPG